MVRISIVFDGSSRGNPGSGYGSFAITKDNQRTVTYLEFGGGMTSHEAGYDTLITALRTLMRQEKTPGDIALDVRSSNPLIVNQVKGSWEARESRMRTRRDQARELLAQFGSVSLTRVSREQVERMLTR
jgi:ribonuclease HI